MSTMSTPMATATDKRANLDMVVVYVKAGDALAERIAQYQETRAAAADPDRCWVNPIIERLEAEQDTISRRITEITKEGLPS